MKHVKQRDVLGCWIASLAMVLEMTYEEVSEHIPLQDWDAVKQSRFNSLGLVGWNNMNALAQTRGWVVFDFPAKPFIAKLGFRYLGMLATADPSLTHVVAIDETGLVFDPENEFFHKD
jgi:uncharacterized protein YvpB